METDDLHFVGKVAHKALIIKEDKVLLVKGAGDVRWDIPGGRIHVGEKPAQALVREVKEELGIDIRACGAFFTDLVPTGKSDEERYFIFFRTEMVDKNQTVVPDTTEVSEILWMPKEKIESTPMYEVCRDALRAYFLTSEHFIGKVTQKALIYLDGKILLNKDVGGTHYDLPGGRLHVKEDTAAGLAREIKEELNVEVEVKNPFYTCQTSWGKEHSPHYFVVYAADLVSPVTDISVDGTEVGEARWVTKEELTTIDIHHECTSAIEKFFAEKVR